MTKNSRLANYEAKQELVRSRAKRAKSDNQKGVLVAAAAVLVALGGQFVYFNFGPGYVEALPETATEESAAETTAEATPTNGPEVPAPELAEGREWQGVLDLNGETLSFNLDGVNAPQATANFVSLAQSGYFENISCHRLVTEGIFVLQCGDPNGDGTGGPGYNFGPIENAPEADVYEKGVIAMARRGGDELSGADFSMGSQFFIVYENSTIPSDGVGGYTGFGSVTSGLEAVEAIAALGTANGSSDGPPAEPVIMTNVSVE